MSAELELVTLAPRQTASHCIIWLHGLGADGNDFVPVAKMLDFQQVPGAPQVEFVFPHAPVQPVTINGGMAMRAWYDIAHPDLNHQPDLHGMAKSCELVNKLIQHKIKQGFTSDKLFLAGFSQGGLIALSIATQSNTQLGGTLALSTYLPAELLQKLPAAKSQQAIIQMHGTQDPVVPLSSARQTYEALKQHNYNIEFHQYNMAHEVNLEQIEHINQWFSARLA